MCLVSIALALTSAAPTDAILLDVFVVAASPPLFGPMVNSGPYPPGHIERDQGWGCDLWTAI